MSIVYLTISRPPLRFRCLPTNKKTSRPQGREAAPVVPPCLRPLTAALFWRPGCSGAESEIASAAGFPPPRLALSVHRSLLVPVAAARSPGPSLVRQLTGCIGWVIQNELVLLVLSGACIIRHTGASRWQLRCATRWPLADSNGERYWRAPPGWTGRSPG